MPTSIRRLNAIDVTANELWCSFFLLQLYDEFSFVKYDKICLYFDFSESLFDFILFYFILKYCTVTTPKQSRKIEFNNRFKQKSRYPLALI